MLLAMLRFAFLLIAILVICLPCPGDARRMQSSIQNLQRRRDGAQGDVDGSMAEDDNEPSEEDELQINQVIDNIGNREAAIDALARTASDLNQHEVPLEMAPVQELLVAVEKVQKEALDFREGLNQDRLALDIPQGATAMGAGSTVLQASVDEGVEESESATARLDALVDKLESAHSSLVDLHRRLEDKMQIIRVMQNIETRTAPIHELQTSASDMSEGEVPSEVASLKEALTMVQKMQKEALYFGEYLNQDTVALDMLSGLADDDRLARKAAIIDMNALADKVDSSKTCLAGLHRKLKDKLQIREVRQSIDHCTPSILVLEITALNLSGSEIPSERMHVQEVLATVAKSQQDASRFGESLSQGMTALGKMSDLAEEEAEACKSAIMDMRALTQKLEASSRVFADLNLKLEGRMKELEFAEVQEAALATISMVLRSPPPGKTFWSQKDIQVQFHSEAQGGVYNLVAKVSGLSTEDLDFDLLPGGVLKVTGLCLPDAEQIQLMRQHIGQQLQQVAQTDPHRLASGVDPSAMFAKLGEGVFGRFLHEVRFPKDADLQNLRVSYDSGVLHLAIPRFPRRSWFR